MLRTVDTDVVVLAVFTVQMLRDRESQPFELWVSFGTGKNHKNIPAHIITSSLGPQGARFLPAFHAFTGCDTVSSFLGKGKKTAMVTWNNFPDVTEALLALTIHPSEINPQLICILQRFVVLLYDSASTKTTVNEARKQMFIQKGRQFDNIPPTEAALLEHVKRTAFQYLESNLDSKPGTSKPSRLGMELRRWDVEPILDNSTRGHEVMSEAY